MPEHIITCPVCKKKYKLTQKDSSQLAQEQFRCPNCKYSAPFKTLIDNLTEPTPQQTTAAPNAAKLPIHNPTKIAQGNQKPMAFLTVVAGNAKFALTPGIYVLGRRSSDSLATLQIAPDITISRQHARLVLQFVNGKLMAQVVGIKAGNPIAVNGVIQATGKPCTLKTGDLLRLGNTQIVFTINKA